MKIFDFNVHLPNETIDSRGRYLRDETVTADSIIRNFTSAKATLENKVQGVHFMFLNSALLEDREAIGKAIAHLKRDMPGCRFTITPDFRRGDPVDQLDAILEAGIDGIKFHSYLQKITDSDFLAVRRFCMAAAERNLPICIDTSYGTSLMYRCDNLRLAAFIAEHLRPLPMVLLHSGGRRVLDAMLLADSCENISLETSFSSNYYKAGPVWQEMIFAYKKLGAARIIYGSDFPYVSIQDAIADTMELCEIAGFSARQIESVFWNNAQAFFQAGRV